MKPNLLIAQSGGPSMVINQSLVGVVLEARATKGFGAILGARHGIAGVLAEDFIDFRKQSPKQLELVAATPASALGSVRRKPSAEDCEKILAILLKNEIKYFFYIGGNDSAETAHIINEASIKAKAGITCFHVPKTIDNDLRGNDHTPGFGSAARFVASALIGDDLDNRALGGVKIDIIMGRNAGFLTAAAALARTEPGDGPHLIYLPERAFDIDRFCDDVKRVCAKLGRCVIAVSEGIADKDGNPIAAKFLKETDSHGNVQLSGSGALGDLLAGVIRERTGIKRVRADTFGYLQRSFPGIASPVDSAEAREVGRCAFIAATSDQFPRGGSIAIKRKASKKYAVDYTVVPLKSVAKNTRSMPSTFINKAGNDVTQAFIDYAKPLLGGLPPKGLL